MNFSNYRITLDIQKSKSQASIPVHHKDTGNRLYITLTDGGNPYKIPDGCRAVFVANRPNPEINEPLVNDCIIENNAVVRYDFNTHTASVEGMHKCELRLIGSNNERITTPLFVMVVDQRVVYDDVIATDEEVAALTALGIIASEEARVKAENGRVLQEELRDEREIDRVGAEGVRKTNENTRQSQENRRFSFESARQTAENNRVAAENARVKAEEARNQVYATKEDKSDADAVRQRLYECEGRLENIEAASEGNIYTYHRQKYENELRDTSILPYVYIEEIAGKTSLANEFKDLRDGTESYLAKISFESCVAEGESMILASSSLNTTDMLGTAYWFTNGNITNSVTLRDVENKSIVWSSKPFTEDGTTVYPEPIVAMRSEGGKGVYNSENNKISIIVKFRAHRKSYFRIPYPGNRITIFSTDINGDVYLGDFQVKLENREDYTYRFVLDFDKQTLEYYTDTSGEHQSISQSVSKEEFTTYIFNWWSKNTSDSTENIELWSLDIIDGQVFEGKNGLKISKPKYVRSKKGNLLEIPSTILNNRDYGLSIPSGRTNMINLRTGEYYHYVDKRAYKQGDEVNSERYTDGITTVYDKYEDSPMFVPASPKKVSVPGDLNLMIYCDFKSNDRLYLADEDGKETGGYFTVAYKRKIT